MGKKWPWETDNSAWLCNHSCQRSQAVWYLESSYCQERLRKRHTPSGYLIWSNFMGTPAPRHTQLQPWSLGPVYPHPRLVNGWKAAYERGIAGDLCDRIVRERDVPIRLQMRLLAAMDAPDNYRAGTY